MEIFWHKRLIAHPQHEIVQMFGNADYVSGHFGGTLSKGIQLFLTSFSYI